MTTCAVVPSAVLEPHAGPPCFAGLQVSASPMAPSCFVCLQPQAMAEHPDSGSVSVHVISRLTQSAETAAQSSKAVSEQQLSTCEEDKGSAFVNQQQQQQQQQQSCDAGQQELGANTPNFPSYAKLAHNAASDQGTQHSGFTTTCLSVQDQLQGTIDKHPSEAQSSQQTTCATSLHHVTHERPHAVRRLSNNPQNSPSPSALLQPAVRAAPRSQALQGIAAVQHNAVPINSQPFMSRPLAQRVVSTVIKPQQLQLSHQPVHKSTPADSQTGTGEQKSVVSKPTMMGDSAVEQTVADSQLKVAATRAPQAMVVAKSVQAKKPKKRVSTKRQSSCC